MKEGLLRAIVPAVAGVSLLLGASVIAATSRGDADHPRLVLGLVLTGAVLTGCVLPKSRYVSRAVFITAVAFVALCLTSAGWVGDDWSAETIVGLVLMVGLPLSLLLGGAALGVSWWLGKRSARA